MEDLKNLLSKMIGTKYNSMSDQNLVNDNTRLQSLLGEETANKISDHLLAFNSNSNTKGAWEDKLKSFLNTNNISSNDPIKDKPTTATTRIPLPDYKNPKSRMAYAQAFSKKYGPLVQGRGDAPLRINEVPFTGTDRLTAKQSAIKAAKSLNMDPALMYASAMEEGMSGTFKKNVEGESPFNSSADLQYPISGMVTFGMDNFASFYPELVKKKYLPADFDKKFKKTVMVNEKGQTVYSGDFKSVEDALQAKVAMVKLSEDQINNYAQKNKITLSPKAKQFFTLVNYNAGEGSAQKMLQDYYKAGALKNDSFLKSRPVSGPNLSEKSWKAAYEHVMRRMQMADALKSEGYFDEETKK